MKCNQNKPNRDDKLRPPNWDGTCECRAAHLFIAYEFKAGLSEDDDDNKTDNMNEDVGNLNEASRKVTGEDINADVPVFACGERCAQER